MFFSRRLAFLLALTACVRAFAVTTTQHDQVRTTTAEYRRTLTDAYLNDGLPKGAWDADARAFLDRMAVRFAEASFDAIYKTEVDTDTDALVKLADPLDGCDDPLVNSCRAVIYKDAGQSDAYGGLLRHFGPKVVTGHYPAYRRYFAAAALARLNADSKAAKQRDDLLLPMLLEKPGDPAFRRNVYRFVVDEYWGGRDAEAARHNKPEARKKLLDAYDAAPDADMWLAHMLHGVDAIDAAWEARGSGYAATVTKEGWAGFEQHIGVAREQLTAAYGLEPGYPEAAARMLTVCMAESDAADARAWFDRAKDAQIDFVAAWQAYGEGLRPRWGGSMEAMQALAHEAAETKRYDTFTPFVTETLLSMMSAENAEGMAVYRRPGVWKDLAGVLDGYMNPVAHGINVPWCGTCRAAYAWRCGEFAEAERTLDALGEQAREDAMPTFETTLTAVKEECAARTGPEAGALDEAGRDRSAGAFAAACDAYDAALKRLPAADPGRGYFRHERANAALRADLDAGKTVPFPLAGADALKDWTGDVTHVHSEGDDLVFDGPGASETTLVHPATLPPKCKITVQWQWTFPQTGHAPGFDVVLQDTGQEGTVTVRHYPLDSVVTMGLGTQYTLAARHPPQVEKILAPGAWHTVEIARDGPTVTVREDGERVFTKYEDGWLTSGRPAVGVAMHACSAGGATVRVRGLTVGPPE